MKITQWYGKGMNEANLLEERLQGENTVNFCDWGAQLASCWSDGRAKLGNSARIREQRKQAGQGGPRDLRRSLIQWDRKEYGNGAQNVFAFFVRWG